MWHPVCPATPPAIAAGAAAPAVEATTAAAPIVTAAGQATPRPTWNQNREGFYIL